MALLGNGANLVNGTTGPSWDIGLNNPGLVAFVSLKGTFGVGGNVKIQNSDDGVTFADVSGLTTLTATTAMQMVATGKRFYRAVCTAGDGTTALLCQIVW
jgi:hypothetical protein